jgi:hypothetical protein
MWKKLYTILATISKDETLRESVMGATMLSALREATWQGSEASVSSARWLPGRKLYRVKSLCWDTTIRYGDERAIAVIEASLQPR